MSADPYNDSGDDNEISGWIFPAIILILIAPIAIFGALIELGVISLITA